MPDTSLETDSICRPPFCPLPITITTEAIAVYFCEASSCLTAHKLTMPNLEGQLHEHFSY